MAHQGTLHRYTARLTAFEHSRADGTRLDGNGDVNTILWIGGLSDGLLTGKYPMAIAASLPSNWFDRKTVQTEPLGLSIDFVIRVLAEVLLSSSYDGWSTGSIKGDARELGECVKYFKDLRPSAKIILIGHSTGCQDIMEYLVGEGASERTAIDGGILLAGVSDREAWASMSAEDEVSERHFHEVIAKAKKWIDENKAKEILPRDGNRLLDMVGQPITAYRAYSLLAKGGDDDFFSSDLPDSALERTFGKVPKETKIMFLCGSDDPYIPSYVDKAGLQRRWAGFVKDGGSTVDEVHGGIVEGGTHGSDSDPEHIVADLVRRMIGFVKGI